MRVAIITDTIICTKILALQVPVEETRSEVFYISASEYLFSHHLVRIYDNIFVPIKRENKSQYRNKILYFHTTNTAFKTYLWLCCYRFYLNAVTILSATLMFASDTVSVHPLTR
jgi:hypothetical protein